jgi:hypothetical protein
MKNSNSKGLRSVKSQKCFERFESNFNNITKDAFQDLSNVSEPKTETKKRESIQYFQIIFQLTNRLVISNSHNATNYNGNFTSCFKLQPF